MMNMIVAFTLSFPEQSVIIKLNAEHFPLHKLRCGLLSEETLNFTSLQKTKSVVEIVTLTY